MPKDHLLPLVTVHTGCISNSKWTDVQCLNHDFLRLNLQPMMWMWMGMFHKAINSDTHTSDSVQRCSLSAAWLTGIMGIAIATETWNLILARSRSIIVRCQLLTQKHAKDITHSKMRTDNKLTFYQYKDNQMTLAAFVIWTYTGQRMLHHHIDRKEL